MICVQCNENQAAIKKSQLCLYCYQKNYRENNNRGRKPLKDLNGKFIRRGKKRIVITHLREMEFVKNFFEHSEWIYHPVNFYLDDNSIYTPDFYDSRRNVFIEVVGSRQAYHHNKEKYQLLKELYPKITFEIREYLGNLVEENENGDLHWEGYKDQHHPIEATA